MNFSQTFTHENKAIADYFFVAHGQLTVPDTCTNQPTKDISNGICNVLLRRPWRGAHFLQFNFADFDLLSHEVLKRFICFIDPVQERIPEGIHDLRHARAREDEGRDVENHFLQR